MKARIGFRHRQPTNICNALSHRSSVSTNSPARRLADRRPCAVCGNWKYAGLAAELTALVGSGRQLGTEGFDPVVTVKESQGGCGYAYDTYRELE